MSDAIGGGPGGGLGQPGERHVRFLGVASEVRLPLLQMAAIAGCDLATLLLAAGLATMLGPALVCGGALLVLAARNPALTGWMLRHTERSARGALRLIALWERYWWVLVAPALAAVYVVVPFRWVTEPPWLWDWLAAKERSHWLLLGGWRVGIGPFARIMLAITMVVVIPALQVGRRRFRNEVDSFAPLAAVDPSQAGTDPRAWGVRELAPEQAITVHVETIQRRDPQRVGSHGIGVGDVITHGTITATLGQWKALTYEAMKHDPSPTDAQMSSYEAFTVKSWRAVKADLIDAGMLRPKGAGTNGANAGYEFDPAFRQVLWSREWSPRKLV